jgi:hypothetical protein
MGFGEARKQAVTQRILSGIRLTWGVWSRWHARDKDLLAPRLGAKTGGNHP